MSIQGITANSKRENGDVATAAHSRAARRVRSASRKSRTQANNVRPGKDKKAKVDRPYPRATLEEAIKIPIAIKEKNGGNPWNPDLVATALGMAKQNPRFFYTAAASRDFGFTEGSRDTNQIVLTDLGRKFAYAPTPRDEEAAKLEAFLNIAVFKSVVDYYKGSELPEMKYLGNVLTDKFALAPAVHEEFASLFQENCKYLKIGRGFNTSTTSDSPVPKVKPDVGPTDMVVYAEPEGGSHLTCFVAMPFTEKMEGRAKGFFTEVLKNLIAPAGRHAGFRVVTAQRHGSDVIHATILRNLLEADLVVADLTDHNPNVLFELGVRMTHNKPVAIIRAEGTKAVFDVDHLLRVYDYNPNLWPSTVEHDIPKLMEHIRGTWDSRESSDTYMNLLLRQTEAQLNK